MSGGGGDTTVMNKTELPEAYRPYALDLLNKGAGLSSQLMSGERQFPQWNVKQVIPDWNEHQILGLDLANRTAQRQTEGMQTADVGNLALRNQMNGMYRNSPAATNPYTDMFVEPSKNPYLGMDNAYLNQVIGKAQGDVVDQYRRGTAAQTDAAFARSGAFGGSAHNERMSANEQTLADALGNISNQMRYADFGAQRGLEEAAIDRSVGAQQQDLQRNAGLRQAQIGLTNQNVQADLGRSLQASGQTPGMAALDWQSLQPMFDMGSQMYGLDQARSDFYRQQETTRQFPELAAMDLLAQSLYGALGNQTQMTQSSSGGGSGNAYAQGLGLAGLLSQFLR